MIEKLIDEKYGFAVSDWPLVENHTPIVFVHGAGGSHLMWIGQLAYFKKDFNPVAVSLPGHNLSPGPAFTAVRDSAEFVIGVADRLNFKKFLLVGLSMGGAISQQIALSHPDRLMGLSLISTGSRLKVTPDLFKLIRENWPGYMAAFPQFAFGKNAPKAVVEQSVKELSKISPLSAEADFRACDAFDLSNEIKNIKTPTLIISAAQDLLTPTKYSDYLQSQIPGSKLVRIQDAGHVVNLEKAGEVNIALREFFSAILGKG
jgi:pimeloyl-ACP methyl ester carboxylesterase